MSNVVGVRQCAEVDNQMMAVERVLEYRDLKEEAQPDQTFAAIDGWPSKGCIELRNVFYRSSTENRPMLRDLSVVINSMENVGIVGRTGAGKSSLIASLFRMASVEGEILIDGIDTAHIPPSELRSRITIIPHNPVLFSGTMKRYEII